MPVSGLVVSLSDEPQLRAEALAAIGQQPQITMGLLEANRLAIVVDTNSSQEDQAIVGMARFASGRFVPRSRLRRLRAADGLDATAGRPRCHPQHDAIPPWVGRTIYKMDADRREFMRAAAMAAASAAVTVRSQIASWVARRGCRPDGQRHPVEQSALSLLRDRLPRSSWRRSGTGGGHCGRQTRRREQRPAVRQGLSRWRDHVRQGSIDQAAAPPREMTWSRSRGKKRSTPLPQRIMRAPEKFAFYGSGQWTIPEGYAAQKFMKGGLGNNHIDPNARLCMASAVTGFIATYGVDEPAGCYDDLDACDVLITWGNNPAENHPVLFSRVIDRPTHGVGGASSLSA